MAPSGGHTESKAETLDPLLVTHFPTSVVIEREAVPNAAAAPLLAWRVAARVVTYETVVWAIDSFASYKSPGRDEIFPALLQEGWKLLVPYLVKTFLPAWQLVCSNHMAPG